jgi:uncharacterized Rmd1/YagE family protein
LGPRRDIEPTTNRTSSRIPRVESASAERPASAMADPLPIPHVVTRVTARALVLGERLDTAGLERSDLISSTPLAFRVGGAGFAVLFRYGVVVLIGLSPIEEDEVVRGISARLTGRYAKIEDETATIEIAPERDDQVVTGGSISLKDLSPPRVLVIADVLAKNVALVRDEREVNKVLELIEPFANRLATTGRGPVNRREMLRVIGQTLLVQHRISGRIAIAEKPDVLWDRSDLERLYARLEDEYELKERANALQHKLQVIEGTSRALVDIIDTERSSRLEATIVLLIVVEVLIAFYELFFRLTK